MIYTGDLVDEKSRTVKLLARREQPRPAAQAGHVRRGRDPQPRGPAPPPQVPASALLTEGDGTFVYVRTGPERFDRREVEVEHRRGRHGRRSSSGLEPGEEVVVEGGFKLKADRPSSAPSARC